MSRKKTTPKRRSWASIKRTKAGSDERSRGYREAIEVFDLAERVREAQERLDIKQLELTTRSGSAQPAIARLGAGGVTPSVDTLRQIASPLGLKLVVELRWRRVAV